MQQRPYEGLWHEHLREGSLMASDFQVGMLVRDMEDNRMFRPIDLPSQEWQKMLLYIDLRDAYHALYDYEAERKVANESLRQNLNELYDRFVRLYRVSERPQEPRADPDGCRWQGDPFLGTEGG